MSKPSVFKNLIGDRTFYKHVLAVALPIMIQNGITNFVSLLDNIMVGRVGTTEMTGVAIANQLIFVFNLCIFGCVSASGIFTAQFYGSGDHKGVADTMRFKLYSGLVLLACGVGIFAVFGKPLVNLYLLGEGSAADAMQSLTCGTQYLYIMLIGLLPFVLVQCYAGTLRETGETFVPMVAGIIAVLVNLLFNWILIFGKFGAPALGAAGAAIATVISRYVEAVIVIAWTHLHKAKNLFAVSLFQTSKVPFKLVRSIILKGMPLMVNELFWAIGVAALAQCYSFRGQHVVAAVNISSTISNLFNVVHLALGSSVSIIIGQLLGAGKMEEAVDRDRKLIAFSCGCCFVIGAVMFVIAPLFPQIYNTTDDVRTLAAQIIRILAVYMPFGAFLHASYFTLRTGGKTIVTFLFDSVFICCISFPAAYLLSHMTALPIVPLYAAVQSLDLIKCVIGFILVKKRVWVNNIIGATK
ncbi:MAG: MATE family efflux transporter [Clostridia bacterium]|nr:MATE family efflux transporter [Clostridia bacterium]